jgi:hypothetical protein
VQFIYYWLISWKISFLPEYPYCGTTHLYQQRLGNDSVSLSSSAQSTHKIPTTQCSGYYLYLILGKFHVQELASQIYVYALCRSIKTVRPNQFSWWIVVKYAKKRMGLCCACRTGSNRWLNSHCDHRTRIHDCKDAVCAIAERHEERGVVVSTNCSPRPVR